MSLTVRGIRISSNLKTGYSLNVDRSWCRPTELCKKICYGRAVSREQAKLEGIHPNKGPITWKGAQECYRVNALRLRLMGREERVALGEKIAERMLARGFDNLRICGMGDLGQPLVDVCLGLMQGQVRPWGFSKRDDMLERLADARDSLGLTLSDQAHPVFAGSADATMPVGRVEKLISATRRLMGKPRLAYVCMDPGWVGRHEITSWPFSRYLKVAFGYHTQSHRTVVDHRLACPATNGQNVHCQECRRCLEP